MSRRKVTRIKMHDLKTLIPGIGNANYNELPPNNKTVKMEMWESPFGIEVHVAGASGISIVPYTNVQIYFTENEAASAPTTIKKVS